MFVEDLKTRVYTIVSDNQNVDELLETLADEVLDLQHMARFVMGKHWKIATKAQKELFTTEYGKYISKVYITQLRMYSHYRMKIMSVRAGGENSYAVRVRMVDTENGDDFVMLEFQIRLTNGSFKIEDVRLNNSISIAVNHRSTTDKVVEKSGIDGAIARFKLG